MCPRKRGKMMENKMKMEKQAENFRQLAKLYYEGNFGTVQKSEIDLLMFHFFYEEKCRETKDRTGSYNTVSDYTLAVELGVTPQRVRALREKVELRYPSKDFDWKKEVKSLISAGKIVKDGEFLCFSVPNPRLFHEIENFVEQNKGVVSYDNNGKVMKVMPLAYVEILKECTGKDEKQIVAALKENLKDNADLAKALTEKGIVKTISECASFVGNIATVLITVGPLLAKSLF